MAPPNAPRRRPPLDSRRLEEIAVRYVGRYATTRAKLRAYLSRKLRECGWNEAREPDLDGLANRFCELGYVDDAAYALAKSQALASRGYGKRRLSEKLRVAGVGEEDSGEARDHADAHALEAALRFAERRRIGPFAAEPPEDPKQRERAIAAMVRAGHSFDLARVIARLEPGTPVDMDVLREQARLDR
ncbi:MAG TPA: regulatory protein RecX [Sphingomicrobium sp.]